MAPSQPENDDLAARISAAQARQAGKTARKPGSGAASGYGIGMKMVLDLVGGALVGLVFGLALDHWLGTRPWGLLILLCLGLVAGFRLMLRTAESHAKRSAENMDADGKDAESAKKG
ncbi:MAG: hypothetical protein CMK06_07090 [Ponticaulis sp.]|nr:hypothetical protein [Ponticaulis sp.]|tara:strand:- start:63709 stop:64059 length:351 start_codon:yes stop_codon:yes gene_type:complete